MPNTNMRASRTQLRRYIRHLQSGNCEIASERYIPCPRKRRKRQNCRRLQLMQQSRRRRQRPTPLLKQRSDLLPLRPLQQQLRRPLLLWLLRRQMRILS